MMSRSATDEALPAFVSNPILGSGYDIQCDPIVRSTGKHPTSFIDISETKSSIWPNFALETRPIYGFTHIRANSGGWWAHQDLNLEPTDYESAALTN